MLVECKEIRSGSSSARPSADSSLADLKAHDLTTSRCAGRAELQPRRCLVWQLRGTAPCDALEFTLRLISLMIRWQLLLL